MYFFLSGGITMRRKKNLKKLLNLGLLDYTNLTPKIGEMDMPYIRCQTIPTLDYLATYSQPSTYFSTSNTAVSFFEYDVFFDGLYGLWSAIYYGIAELQDFYRERFHGVRCFIAPDFSKCGDVSEAENVHRQFRSRIVAIWLTMNLNAVVIPLVSCANATGMKYMLDGMQDCSIVAFNAKGPMGDPNQLPVFKESIQYAVDHLPNLKSIVIYTASPSDEKVKEIFSYAIAREIELQIPDNMLRQRNRLRGGCA